MTYKCVNLTGSRILILELYLIVLLQISNWPTSSFLEHMYETHYKSNCLSTCTTSPRAWIKYGLSIAYLPNLRLSISRSRSSLKTISECLGDQMSAKVNSYWAKVDNSCRGYTNMQGRPCEMDLLNWAFVKTIRAHASITCQSGRTTRHALLKCHYCNIDTHTQTHRYTQIHRHRTYHSDYVGMSVNSLVMSRCRQWVCE